MTKGYLSLFIFLFSFCAGAFQVPTLTGPVVDQANLFSQSEKIKIESLIRNIYQTQVAQIQVLTVPSLEGETIEQASIQVVEQWKIGFGASNNEHRDNGILIFVVRDERKIRIEIGRGLEGDLPDIYASRIIRNIMTPYFKNNQFGEGVLKAIENIQSILIKKVPPELQNQIGESQRDDQFLTWARLALFLCFFVIFFLGPIILPILGLSKRKYGGYRGIGGGGFGGGFGGGGGWSGGGGGFSGGGASGGW